MTLLVENISMWEIGFRWHGHSPDWPKWKKIPLEVKDSFKNMTEGMLRKRLIPMNLIMEKPGKNPKQPREFYFYTYIDDIHLINQGIKYERSLLKRIQFERVDFIDWCINENISPPSFWISNSKINAHKIRIKGGSHNKDYKSKEKCRDIASRLWSENPNLTIKEIIFHDEIQNVRPDKTYTEKTLRGWINDLDPRPSSQKRGRPPKNK